MLNLTEYRKKPQILADFLPWAALVAEGIVLNKDGSFQRIARFRGRDLDGATPAELVGTTARLNNALRRLGSGWAIFVEASRVPAQHYPRSRFPDAVSALVDTERREQFEQDGVHFESFYYFTLVWMPPAKDASRAESWLYEGRSREGVDCKELLEGFADRTDRLLQLVEGFVPEVFWLDDEDTLTYLHACVSTKRHRVRLPEVPMYLDALLADLLMTGGREPRLGSHHLRTLSIIGFPASTFPGILDELNRLAFPYRWSTRAIMLDKSEATRLLTKIRRQWFAKRKSIAAILKEVMTNEASTLLDTDAANKAAVADMAVQELGSDEIGKAYVTDTVTVWDKEAGVAAEKLRLAEKVIQGRDFTCIVETVNAIVCDIECAVFWDHIAPLTGRGLFRGATSGSRLRKLGFLDPLNGAAGDLLAEIRLVGFSKATHVFEHFLGLVEAPRVDIFSGDIENDLFEWLDQFAAGEDRLKLAILHGEAQLGSDVFRVHKPSQSGE